MEFRIVVRVAGDERVRLRHRTVMISMETFGPTTIPDALRARMQAYLPA